jgi:P27 family predicted phage terminase small subunit
VSQRKAPERRQRRGTKDLAVVAELPPATPPMPKPPGGGQFLAATKSAWEAFWADPLLANLVKPADQPALVRLFGLYDERERMVREVKRQRMTKGSTGQVTVNPASKEVASLDGRIDKLEAAFGITPKARLALGISLGAAARSLDDINRAFEDDEDDDGRDDEDPRLAAIDTTAS